MDPRAADPDEILHRSFGESSVYRRAFAWTRRMPLAGRERLARALPPTLKDHDGMIYVRQHGFPDSHEFAVTS